MFLSYKSATLYPLDSIPPSALPVAPHRTSDEGQESHEVTSALSPPRVGLGPGTACLLQTAWVLRTAWGQSGKPQQGHGTKRLIFLLDSPGAAAPPSSFWNIPETSLRCLRL